MPRLDPIELKSILEETDARWKASEGEMEYTLGYNPGPTEDSLAAREFVAHANYQHFVAMAAAARRPYPAAFDWRKVSGEDYITPIRDQKGCGSCVAFGSVATVEALVRIQKKDPKLDIDLSEADLFFCHEGVDGGTCDTGWYVDAALSALTSGIVDEKCFPYADQDQPCKRCQDWESRLTKISRFHKITAIGAMKTWLAKNGPLVTCFNVYADFFSYHSGVYHHVSGALQGGHCVCCIGYNDRKRYWICKNSWGPAWGNHGFFQIAYGQVGIDATMWAVEL
jgi:C1A family cysteine protease